MREFLTSLPQGVYWYPVVIVLAVIAVRALVDLRRERPRFRTVVKSPDDRFGRWSHLVRRSTTDVAAAAELERVCIGMLLGAVGYRGYTVGNCRDYLDRGAPEAIERAIRRHLDGEPECATDPGALPPVCEVVVSYLEKLTEE